MPTLMLGRAADAEVLLRAIESGAVEENLAGRHPVAVARRPGSDRCAAFRCSATSTISNAWLPILPAAAPGDARRADAVGAFAGGASRKRFLMRARRLGLTMSQLPSLDDGGEALRLAPVTVEDLLLRPSVKIDYRRLETFVKGKSIVVTGGGGSIGSEICDRIVTFGAARLLVIENSEPALHAVLEALAAKQRRRRRGRIADIRDRARDHAPDRGFQAGHRVPRRGAQARAAARAGLGRGRQDQRVRLGQCRRCGGGGRRGRHGDDLDRQGDRAGLGARRHQAVRGNVLPGAR